MTNNITHNSNTITDNNTKKHKAQNNNDQEWDLMRLKLLIPLYFTDILICYIRF